MIENGAGGGDDSSADRPPFRHVAFAIWMALLFALSIWLAVPYFSAIVWAVALAIIAWPLHRAIGNYIAWPNVAAALTALVVVLIILIPSVFVTVHLAREAKTAADYVQPDTGVGAWRDHVAAMPVFGHVMAWLDNANLDMEGEVRKVVAANTQDLSGLAAGSLGTVVKFLVAVFVLFFLVRDRALFLNAARELLPLSRSEADRVFASAADSVHANLYATVITSLIDAGGGGLMFWALGLPAPVLWGVVIFVLSIVPVVGAGMVWGPAVVYLICEGQWLAALALLSWGIITAIVVDNVLYMRIAGDRMQMHQVPAMIAFLGGLAVFGLSGVIIGPAIAAVTFAFVDIWKQRTADNWHADRSTFHQ